MWADVKHLVTTAGGNSEEPQAIFCMDPDEQHPQYPSVFGEDLRVLHRNSDGSYAEIWCMTYIDKVKSAYLGATPWVVVEHPSKKLFVLIPRSICHTSLSQKLL